MLIALLVLLGSQLIGESVTRLLGLTIPGPVLGLVLLAVAAAASARVRTRSSRRRPDCCGICRCCLCRRASASCSICRASCPKAPRSGRQ